MRISRLGCTAVLLATLTGSASASTITMHGGKGSIPFGSNFTITLDSTTGTDCLDSNLNPVACVFQNQVGETVTQIDLAFQIPSLPSSDTCAIGAGSPFSECNVAFVSISSPGPSGIKYEEIFEFYDGSLPNTNEFGLDFSGFQPGSQFGGTAVADPGGDPVPEPGSAILLLTALGAAIMLRKLSHSDA